MIFDSPDSGRPVVPDGAIVVVAAGEGTRLGYGMPKAYVPLAGRPLLLWCLDGVADATSSLEVVVVAPADLVARTETMVAGVAHGIRVVAGGATRQTSVAAGLAALTSGAPIVLVHDAARAQTPATLVDAVVDGVRQYGVGIVPGLAVADTVKRVDGGGRVEETVDRSTLSAVQTPQGFPRAALEAAYAAATVDETDDAGVFQAAGHDVQIIPGDPRAAKITTPDDLVRAELRLGEVAVRAGVGVDVHAFAPSDGKVLRLAGLDWPGERALDGHSDGDAVAHAVCDALLSAAGLGDIGSSFGVDDPVYAGAEGGVFVRGAVEILRAAGWRPSNVAVQIVGNRPRFSGRRAEAEAVMTELVGAPVSVSATTTDGLGFTGRGEGVQVIATALVRSATGGPVTSTPPR